MSTLVIPAQLKPKDGRFGSGPAKIRPEQLAALAASGATYLGTSHRQPPVRSLVRRIRTGLTELFSLPDGYTVVLGNGGTSAFWEMATSGLVREHSQHLSFGEFSARFAALARRAPWLAEPTVVESVLGTHPAPWPEPGADGYALTHNETSTGVAMPVQRVPGADPGSLILVDATSAAGGLPVRPQEFDVYYFAPQKGLGSDGGLWIALMSPAAVERVHEIAASGRYIPDFLSLRIALENAARDQTYNTPAVATLFLLADQIEWMLGHGGLPWTTARTAQSAAILYTWAEKAAYADALRRRSGPALAGRRDDRRRQRGTRGRHSGVLAGEWHRRHRVLPEAGPQSATHRDVPRSRSRGRGRPHRLHRLPGRASGRLADDRSDQYRKQQEHEHGRKQPSGQPVHDDSLYTSHARQDPRWIMGNNAHQGDCSASRLARRARV